MKNILFPVLLVIALLLGACTGTPAASMEADETSTLVADLVNQGLTQSVPVATEDSSVVHSVALTMDYENAVSIEMQLILGILKLEGTSLALTAEQAQASLPLWETYSTLSEGMRPSMETIGQGDMSQQPTANPETQMQLSDLTSQIQMVMNAEQIQAIAEMKITNEAAQSLMQELGLEMGNPQQGMGGGGPSDANGQMPQGTPPVNEQQPPSNDLMGTPPTRGDGGFMSPQVLELFRQFLEQRAAS